MTSLFLRRIVMTAAVAITVILPPSAGFAAIPCDDLEVIPAPPNMKVPMIYIELPVDASMLFGRGTGADRSNAEAADDETASRLESAARNQIRCLDYEMSSVFLGNATPQYRVMTAGVIDLQLDEQYADIASLHLVQFGEKMIMDDDRFLIDYVAIVDNGTLLVGEMVFTELEGSLYLDSAHLVTNTELVNQHEIDVSERFTREVKIVEVTNFDSITFNNLSKESMAAITIVDPNGDTIFEGHDLGDTMVGGDNADVFVVNDLEPGDYVATVTFDQSGISMSVTIRVVD